MHSPCEGMCLGGVLLLLLNQPHLYEDFSGFDYVAPPPIAANTTVVLISYADSNAIHYINQLELSRSALNKGVDFVLNYRRKHLEPQFQQAFAAVLNNPKGAGYWLWKPYLILKTLKQLPEGAVLVYLDSGAVLINEIMPLVEQAQHYGRVLFQGRSLNRVRTKRDCFILMDSDSPQYYNRPQVIAGFIVLVNNQINRDFVQKWFEYCQDQRILTDQPSRLGQELPEFLFHTHDQSVLSLLALKQENYGVILEREEAYKYIVLHHRRRMSNP